MNKRIKLLAITGLTVTALTGVTLGAITSTSTQADEASPIVAQVENHEGRITGLETETDQIKQDVAGIEQKTNDNTTTITQTKDRVVVVEKRVAEQPTPPAPEQPAPKPTPAPLTITKVTKTFDPSGKYPKLKCEYQTHGGELYWSGEISPYTTDEPCPLKEGTVLNSTMIINYGLTNRPVDM